MLVALRISCFSALGTFRTCKEIKTQKDIFIVGKFPMDFIDFPFNVFSKDKAIMKDNYQNVL